MDLSKEIDGIRVYSHNGFRIFNLPITAKSNKVNKEFNKVDSARKLNDLDAKESLDIYDNLPFPITPKPNFLDYQNAKNRLSQSRSRFLEELFWFWPEDLDSRSDEALKALKKGDVNSAVSIWQSSDAANARHNVAVYYHVLAVDDERAGNYSSSDKYWKDALSKWHKTLSTVDFKNLVLTRVQKLNDPTLKEDYVNDVFSQLPVAILSLNAGLAEEYHSKGDKSNFGRHIKIVKNSDFDDFTKKEALQKIFDKLYDSVNEKFEDFESQDYNKRSDIPKIEKFLASIDEDISLLSEYFSDESQFQLLSDNIAKSVKGCYVGIVNNEDSFDGFDFDQLIRVFNALIEMAYTVTVRDEIKNNLEQLKRIKESRKYAGEDDEIHEEILAFLKKDENVSMSEAKSYSKRMQSKIDNSSSPNKDTLSDGFAISLRNFVVSTINACGTDLSKISKMRDDLIEILRTARQYATDKDTKDKIDEDLSLLRKIPSGGSGGSVTTPTGGGGSGGDTAKTIACIAVVIVALLAAWIFLGV